jgi:L-rhamnose mutarotase
MDYGETVMKRMLFWGRIRPDKIEEYKKSHNPVWPELEACYRKNGISKVSCLLHGNDLLVYTEYDPEIYLKGGKERIAQDPVAQKWDKWMLEFHLEGFTAVEFQEVYRME